MQKSIEEYVNEVFAKSHRLTQVNLKKIADHFGGTVARGRYIRIGGDDWKLERNWKTLDWEAKKMDWGHGNDWTYFYPY